MNQISTLDKSSQRTTSSQVFMNTSVYYLLMHICLLLDRRAIKKILASSRQRAYNNCFRRDMGSTSLQRSTFSRLPKAGCPIEA